MTSEERISRLEGAYEQVDKRLDDLTQAVNGLRNDMNTQVGGLRNDMNARFSQQLGIMGVGWATLMAAVLAVLFIG